MWNIKKSNWKIWLIMSTFGIGNNEDHKLPKNLCQFVPKFLLSILAIPISWFGHIINILSKNKGVNAGGQLC
jgi:hypothetical protein